MDIAVIAVSLAAVVLLGASLRAPHAHATLPLLFVLMVASILLGYLGASQGSPFVGVVAAAGTVAATAGLAATLHARDAQLAAAGDAAVLLRLGGGSRRGRWRRFERQFWAHVAAHGRGHGGERTDRSADER